MTVEDSLPVEDPEAQCREDGCREPVEWSQSGAWTISSLDQPVGEPPFGRYEGYCMRHNREHYGFGTVKLIYRDGILSMIAKHGQDALQWPEIERYAAWLED